MPTAIPNGGSAITTSELGAYYAVSSIASGQQTSTEAGIATEIDEKAAAVSQGWEDSGGPGGFQADVAAEIVTRAAVLQGQVQASVRQWETPGRERATMEMMGSLMQALIERDRLLLELRERLNASPY
jgi:hypothetical protein